MDGTCNGLQYYAALGRDVKGGKSVNLVPSDVPQDVYGEVLEIVKATVGENKGDKWELLRANKWLLARKTVKTTVRSLFSTPFLSASGKGADHKSLSFLHVQVMTSVYGQSSDAKRVEAERERRD